MRIRNNGFPILPALVIASASACGSGDAAARECGEPIYDGAANDEAWSALEDANAQVDDERAPLISSPAAGTKLDSSGFAPRIEWSASLAASPADHRPQRLRAIDSFWSLMLGRAHAHGLAVTGPFFVLTVQIPGHACPVTAATTETSWQMDGATWSTVRKATGKSISIRIRGAYLEDDDVTEGPFVATKGLTLPVE